MHLSLRITAPRPPCLRQGFCLLLRDGRQQASASQIGPPATAPRGPETDGLAAGLLPHTAGQARNHWGHSQVGEHQG